MKHINITDKKAGKFKEWLKIGSHSELKPNQELIEVLSYLAFETVREVSRKVVKRWNHSSKKRRFHIHYIWFGRGFVVLHSNVLPLLQIVEMSLQVKKDMEDVYLDPCSAHSSHLPLHVPLFTTNHLEGLSISLGTFCDGVCTGNSSPLNSTTLGSPKTGVGHSLSGHSLSSHLDHNLI